MAVVVDTSFLIDVADGHLAAQDLVDRFAEDHELILIPTVVVAEYLAGSSAPEEDVEKLRAAGEILDLTARDAEAAGALAREAIDEGAFPGWSDILIAGVARSRGDVPVVTANAEHFPSVETVTY